MLFGCFVVITLPSYPIEHLTKLLDVHTDSLVR
jgi:hypothetical protein